MRIHDYETGHQLRDIEIELTREEVEDLAAYLACMLKRTDLRVVQMSDVSKGFIDGELSISLAGQAFVA